jgi:putative transposase
MHDVLASGQKIRVFTLVSLHWSTCTREEVARILSDVGKERRKLPEVIQVDNGTEFTSNALDHGVYCNRVELDFSRPAKPVDNCIVEAFNGIPRRECRAGRAGRPAMRGSRPSLHWFASLQEAQALLNDWRMDYNNVRPHSSLANDTPAKYAATATGGHYIPNRSRLKN